MKVTRTSILWSWEAVESVVLVKDLSNLTIDSFEEVKYEDTQYEAGQKSRNPQLRSQTYASFKHMGTVRNQFPGESFLFCCAIPNPEMTLPV